MACRDAIERQKRNAAIAAQEAQTKVPKSPKNERLLFGVDSTVQSNDVLQNNLTEFEWVKRNKIYPNFWGRNITGKNSLTRKEISFLHNMGCKIAVIDTEANTTGTEEQGKLYAKKIALTAMELGIPQGTAIFMEIDESAMVSSNYLIGYANGLISEGYTPGFKTSTDAYSDFDRAYCLAIRVDKEAITKCLIWSITPSIEKYNKITTSHFIHPDEWKPYAPSCITRNDISIWQYGREGHPILDDEGNKVTFNMNLVKNAQIIIDKMF